MFRFNAVGILSTSRLRGCLKSFEKVILITPVALTLSRLALKIVVIARQEARGNSKESFSDFTFLYTVWFYCVHLLRRIMPT
ncbi:hypothetical protein FJR39_12925 [Dolichospermum flos-aquae UHCC 0037]|uniref:Uncharacterized protein n=1 Tax=Dolichospermum flos-aquae UHCC 0037 TaxID=2590026 RepID=A0ACC7S6B1_DOLFA|nr:hypothetical protein [Dolichospermum flos-aquae UHCC 0037]